MLNKFFCVNVDGERFPNAIFFIYNFFFRYSFILYLIPTCAAVDFSCDTPPNFGPEVIGGVYAGEAEYATHPAFSRSASVAPPCHRSTKRRLGSGVPPAGREPCSVLQSTGGMPHVD